MRGSLGPYKVDENSLYRSTSLHHKIIMAVLEEGLSVRKDGMLEYDSSRSVSFSKIHEKLKEPGVRKDYMSNAVDILDEILESSVAEGSRVYRIKPGLAYTCLGLFGAYHRFYKNSTEINPNKLVDFHLAATSAPGRSN